MLPVIDLTKVSYIGIKHKEGFEKKGESNSKKSFIIIA